MVLRAVFDTTYATVKDIINLHVGDVIRVEHPVNKDITVKVEHIPKFKGKLGQKGQRLAVKVSEILKGVSDDE